MERVWMVRRRRPPRATRLPYTTLFRAARQGSEFAGVLAYYDHLTEHLRWKNLGHVRGGGNWDPGDISGKKELDEARALGAAQILTL